MLLKSFYSLLAQPLSALYAMVVFARNKAYDTQKIKPVQTKSKVLSIGNIVAGGTGKTPWTLKMAKDLKTQGREIAILSRGYRSKFEHQKKPTLICDKKGPLYPPKLCGDEPYLICQNFPDVLFYVGKNRVQSAFEAGKREARLLLLDDGMQHRQLHRDFECILVDARDLFGRGYFLPSGRLRDSPKRLSIADLIVVNHLRDLKDIPKIESQLRLYTQAPLVFARFEFKGFFDLNQKPVSLQKKTACAAFCGLGQPKGFYELLQSRQLHLVLQKNLKDHEPFKEDALHLWAKKAAQKGAKVLICTEKDAVKLPKDLQLSLPLLQLKVEPKIVQGQEEYQTFLEKINSATFSQK